MKFVSTFFVLLITFFVSVAQNYTIHKVQAGETLYGISKKYNTTVDVLYKNNPSLSSGALKIGTDIRIPSAKSTSTSTKTTTTVQKNTTVALDTILHQVKPKETLYGISKLYGVSMDNIKKWNNLGETDIKIDALLKIIKPKSNTETANLNKTEMQKFEEFVKQKKQEEINASKPTTAPEVKKETVPTTTEETPKVEEVSTPIINKSVPLSEQFAQQQKYENVMSYKATGAPMNTSDNTIDNTFFAMHKTAKVGSVIKVRNLENNKISYAKVIGTLPDTDENKKVMVRLSLGVAKAIKMGNGKAYLEIFYVE